MSDIGDFPRCADTAASDEPMSSPDLRRRVLTGTAWSLAATFFTHGSIFAVRIVLARFLGMEGFGEYSIIQTTLTTIAVLAQLSMGYTATKYVAEFRSTDRQRTERILGLCAVVTAVFAVLGTAVLVAASPWLSERALNAPHLAPALMIGAGFALFSAFNGYLMGALAGLESYPSIAKAAAFGSIATVVGVSLGAWTLGLNGAMLGLTASAALQSLFYHWYLRAELSRQGLRARYDNLGREREIVFGFALPAALNGYFSMPSIWLARTVLVRQPDGYEEMALYGAAWTIRSLAQVVPIVANTVGLAILNHVKGSGDAARYQRLFQENVAFIFLTTLAAAAVLMGFSDFFLRAFGRGFSEGKLVLWILLASTLPESLAVGLYQYIQSQGRMWLTFPGLVVPRQTLYVVMAYVLVPDHGAVGLAIAFLISMLFGLPCTVAIMMVISRQQKRAQLSHRSSP
jgi:O-antigen/teichoic acid export membrane protein